MPISLFETPFGHFHFHPISGLDPDLIPTVCLKKKVSLPIFREDLPVLDQLLPDDFPHDLCADAEQLGDGGVGVVEAVQQNLRHLPLLLPHQPLEEGQIIVDSNCGFKGVLQ